MQLYPALDLRDGNVVRLYQGDFAKEQRYALDPVAQAQSYADAGADWLHVVDLDGARSGVSGNLSIIADICKRTSLKVQAGGGVRSAEVCQSLLDVGVARVVVGSKAITEPEVVMSWLTRYGAAKIAIALDALCDEFGVWHVQVSGWTAPAPMTLQEALKRYEAAGVLHVLCTDISRDGTLAGPNLALYRELYRAFPKVSVQASGGVSMLDDLKALKMMGVAGAVIGKALLDGRFSMAEALAC